MNGIPTELAHDLRMPLQLILSCAQLLRAELGDAPSPAAGYADLLMDSVRQLEVLLEGSLSAPDAPPRPGRFDLAASLRALCLRCQPAAAERGVGLRCVSNAAALPVVSDEERLTRLVMNLLSNALRFTPPGGSVTLCSPRWVTGWRSPSPTPAAASRRSGCPGCSTPERPQAGTATGSPSAGSSPGSWAAACGRSPSRAGAAPSRCACR